MRNRLFQLPARVRPATRLAIAFTGFVLVHIAAWLLYTASAPYLGSMLGLLGMALFMAGSRKAKSRPPPKRRGETDRRKHYYFNA